MAGIDPDERAQIIDTFVARLVQTRAEAGDPSFRQMAKRSGAISHATMHDAVQGVRLPSWETTVEFARACGIDPGALRTEWERADATLHPAETTAEPSGTEDAGPQESGPTPVAVTPWPVSAPPHAGARAPDLAAHPAPNVRPTPAEAQGGTRQAAPRRGSLRLPLSVAAGLALLLLAGLGIRQLTSEPADATPPAAAAAASTSTTSTSARAVAGSPAVPPGVVPTKIGPEGCPVNDTHATKQLPPRTKGDKGKMQDRTIADCSVQPRGKPAEKVFRLFNTGAVPWVGRKLVRINHHETNPACRMPPEVPIQDTKPGKYVDVKVVVSVPEKPVICFARWMQMDQDNQWAFPDQRPYYLTFKVK